MMQDFKGVSDHFGMLYAIKGYEVFYTFYHCNHENKQK